MKFVLLCLFLFVVISADRNYGGAYFNNEEGSLQVLNTDYINNNMESLMRAAQRKRTSLIYLFRRACIRRGGNCDHRPKDCCYSSSCRCNLWGSNCKCQRMGLFQKWG